MSTEGSSPDVAALDDATLRATLLTADYKGRAVKEAALEELLKRAYSQGATNLLETI